MIVYKPGDYEDIVKRLEGTVLESQDGRVYETWSRCAAYAVFSYLLLVLVGEDLTPFPALKGPSGLAPKLMAFVLVFRANTAYGRYRKGKQQIHTMVRELREVALHGLVLLKGGPATEKWRNGERDGDGGYTIFEDTYTISDWHGTCARIHMCRWLLAVAVSAQCYMRLGWDGYQHGFLDPASGDRLGFERNRLRTLLTEKEFQDLDLFHGAKKNAGTMLGKPTACYKPCRVDANPRVRQLHAIFLSLQQALQMTLNDPVANDRQWGMKEKFVGLFWKKTLLVEKAWLAIAQIQSTPIPWPYYHMLRTLLGVYFVTAPMMVQQSMGWFANMVMPALTLYALLGIDAIASELENPFGDDANDLDYNGVLAGFEQNLLTILEQVGDDQAKDAFVWVRAGPDDLPSCKYFGDKYLALRSRVVERDRYSALPREMLDEDLLVVLKERERRAKGIGDDSEEEEEEEEEEDED